MQIYQASLHFELIQLGPTDPLTKPVTYVEYMAGAFKDCANEESLWLISMNPKRRPIARTLLRTGPCAAAMTPTRDLFRVALYADANVIALVRGEPGLDVKMTQHDQHAATRFFETAACLGIQLIDYLVISTSSDLRSLVFHSWNAVKRR